MKLCLSVVKGVESSKAEEKGRPELEQPSEGDSVYHSLKKAACLAAPTRHSFIYSYHSQHTVFQTVKAPALYSECVPAQITPAVALVKQFARGV